MKLFCVSLALCFAGLFVDAASGQNYAFIHQWTTGSFEENGNIAKCVSRFEVDLPVQGAPDPIFGWYDYALAIQVINGSALGPDEMPMPLWTSLAHSSHFKASDVHPQTGEISVAWEMISPNYPNSPNKRQAGKVGLAEGPTYTARVILVRVNYSVIESNPNRYTPVPNNHPEQRFYVHLDEIESLSEWANTFWYPCFESEWDDGIE